MADFIMTVFPGEQENITTKKLKNNAVVISSRQIRKEFGNEANKNLIFEEMGKRSRNALCAGQNVVFLSSNLNRKKRIFVLRQTLKNVECRKICKLIIVPPEDCGDRLRKFECPGIYEGFDRIDIDWYKSDIDAAFLDDRNLLNFDQETSYHTATVGKHLLMAEHYAEEHGFSDEIVLAAALHDIGKPFTKDHHDTHGNYTENAHYYGHENYGSYLSLVARNWEINNGVEDNLDDSQWLYVSQLINWHMAPHNKWKQSEKARIKDLNLLGEDMVRDIYLLNECDLNAH